MKIDLEQLRKEIREMSRKTMLYEVLRDELTELGYWRRLGRGNPTYVQSGLTELSCRISV